MLNLLRAEWLKLSRRPLIWVLLLIILGTMLLLFLGWFMLVALSDGLFFGGETRIQLGDAAAIEQYRLRVSFPGVFGAVLGQINSIGGICAIILAAMAMGSEFDWGTLRVQLARQPLRGRYLVAKILMILFILLIWIGITLLFGVLLAALFGNWLGTPGSIAARDLLVLPVGILRSIYIILPYVLATLAISIFGRSVFIGVAGGIAFLSLDAGSGTLVWLTQLNIPLLTFLVNLPLQQNIGTLVEQNARLYGLDNSAIAPISAVALPPPLQANILIALYSLLFFCSAYLLLMRRDIGGAAS